jgi:hypothetical protein
VGASAPVATVLENTFGSVPVWTRAFAGKYDLRFAGDNPDFPQDRTTVDVGGRVFGDSGNFGFGEASVVNNGVDHYIRVNTFDVTDTNKTETDSLMLRTLFELRVYS